MILLRLNGIGTVSPPLDRSACNIDVLCIMRFFVVLFFVAVLTAKHVCSRFPDCFCSFRFQLVALDSYTVPLHCSHIASLLLTPILSSWRKTIYLGFFFFHCTLFCLYFFCELPFYWTFEHAFPACASFPVTSPPASCYEYASLCPYDFIVHVEETF